MQRAERRNISITNDEVSVYLDRQQNVSKFLEGLVLDYMQKQEKQYAEQEQFEELKVQVEILNKNYLQTRDTVTKMVEALFGRVENE